MKSLQVRHAPTAIELLSVNLSDVMALPDAEAALALNDRMAAHVQIDRWHERSYVERGIIAREFERRKLWAHLIDPETGHAFPNFSAWMACSDFLGCRRTNFESLRDMKMLADVPEEKLIDVPKGNLKVLAQLSTAVRNDPDILEAAKTLPRDQFEAKVEQEQPHQHIEGRKPLRFSFGRSQAKTVEKWIAYALEHDIAGGREEAMERACEMALYDVELAEELRNMPEVPEKV